MPSSPRKSPAKSPSKRPSSPRSRKSRPSKLWARSIGVRALTFDEPVGMLFPIGQGMHVLPHLATAGVVMLLFSMASLFLETYTVTAGSHLALFVVGSYVVFSTYYVFDAKLKELSSSYRAIQEDKQFYVLSNIIKSGMLCAYTPLAVMLLNQIIRFDEWPTHRIRNMGVLYAIPDFVSLFMVKRMAKTTKIHHICVVVFMSVSLLNDYSEINVCRGMVVYAVFSCFAYLVNLLLASRWFGMSEMVSATMSLLSLLVYITCCGINWYYQIWLICKQLYPHYYPGDGTGFLLFTVHWSIVVYVLLISLIVYDDIVLIGWLKANVTSKFSAASPKKKQ